MGSSLLSLAKLETLRSKIRTHKIKKVKRWLKWVSSRLMKKGYLADTDICAYGNDQLVGKVKEFGGGYIFWSKACSGCTVGIIMLEEFKKKKKVPEQSPCILLKNALITKTKVSEGEVVKLLP